MCFGTAKTPPTHSQNRPVGQQDSLLNKGGSAAREKEHQRKYGRDRGGPFRLGYVLCYA